MNTDDIILLCVHVLTGVVIQKNIFLKNHVGGTFSRGDLSWESGGTLPQNSYKPSQDLQEATL